MYAHLLCGNREIFVLPWETVPRAASGRPEAIADDERGEEVRLIDSTCEAGEQSGAIRRGAGGGRRFFNLKKRAAPGADAADLERHLTDLHARVHSGAYRALPSRRKYIPKADGKQRPLGIAALEDKIVQAAVVAILTPIYEAEFLGFSYGFRPKRNQHQALDALAFGIGKRRINWVLDCDVQSFFDKVSRDWLIRFVEHRIGDHRIIRLIAKWLTAGVLEDGRMIETEEGTPQGAVISPLLANIYLHHVYDQWVHQWRQQCATGDVVVVRYADDAIVGFEHRQAGEQFLADLKARLPAS